MANHKQFRAGRDTNHANSMFLVVALCGVVSACAVSPNPGSGPAAVSTTLANRQWTLIEVRTPPQSAPTEVALNKYTMTLSANGTAAFVLDCNRGTGNWSTDQNSNGQPILSFGPIAATRALCPDDGLGERLARDLGTGLPYDIYDGRLTIRAPTATYTFDTID